MGATGRKYSWSSPKENQEGTREDSGIPGIARSPEPALRRALPAPAVPARRKRSLCGYDSRSCPFPAPPGAGRAVSSAPFKFWGAGLVRSPCSGFRPRCLLLSAGGCARSAAPLTPASARPRPPGMGHCSGALSTLSPTSHPFTRNRAERSEGPIHAAPPSPGPARS